MKPIRLCLVILVGLLVGSAGPIRAADAPGASAGAGAEGADGKPASTLVQTIPLSGRTSLNKEFSPALKLEPGQELAVTGVNRSSTPVVLILRIDDGKSTNYASRLGEEHTVPPGAFRLRYAPGLWKTPSGRYIDPADIRAMYLFVGEKQPQLDIDKVTVERGFLMPDKARGWKFGPPGVAVFPGFKLVVPGDQQIAPGPTIVLVNRPSADGLIGSGLKNIQRLDLEIPNGRYNVTLWTEDVGEWEYLPHPLQRVIRLQGHIIHEERWSPDQWIRHTYMYGRDFEALADGDPWDVIEKRRGGLIEGTADVTNGRLVIEQSGDVADSSFLSAVLAEPAGSHEVLDALQLARRERYLERWPVQRYALAPRYTGPLAMGVLKAGEKPSPAWRPAADPPAAVPRPVARGGSVSVDLMAISADDARQVTAVNVPPIQNGQTLPAEIRWGQWRFMRKEGVNTLNVTADHLRGDIEAMPLRRSLPRRLNLLIQVPETATPGVYRGSVTVGVGEHTASAAYAIEVLPVTLPPVDRPVGVYFDDQPFLAWFDVPMKDRNRDEACDLSFLHRIGLTGIAPHLSTPDKEGVAPLVDQIRIIRDAGFKFPIVAYTPVKSLVNQIGIDGIGQPMGEAARALTKAQLPLPLWSIADEPGNPGSMPDDIERMRAGVKGAIPQAKVLGQLNQPQDRALLHLFDVVLVNTGFGVDAAEIPKIEAQGTELWLYNMPEIETAAGFFLWRSGAHGYLQWHGREPTGDPWDPTDGRETDFMLMPITAQSCLAVPDIDTDLEAMVRGIDDLRWMLWLTDRAKTDPAATALLDKIRNIVPASWSRFAPLPIDLSALRADLIAFARKSV